jgi:hypothetical protein
MDRVAAMLDNIRMTRNGTREELTRNLHERTERAERWRGLGTHERHLVVQDPLGRVVHILELALALRRATSRGLLSRRVVATAVLLIGVWSLTTRTRLLEPGDHGSHGARSDDPDKLEADLSRLVGNMKLASEKDGERRRGPLRP